MPFIKVNSERCKGCQLCIGVCPRHMLALADVLNQLGVTPVEVVGDPSQCSGCMSCTLMCPDVAIEISETAPAPETQDSKK